MTLQLAWSLQFSCSPNAVRQSLMNGLLAVRWLSIGHFVVSKIRRTGMSLRRGAGTSVYQLRDEMDRLFNGFFPTVARTASMAGGRSFPAVNVWEDGDNLFAEAEVPGLK